MLVRPSSVNARSARRRSTAVPVDVAGATERHGSSRSGDVRAVSDALPPVDVTRWDVSDDSRSVPRARAEKLAAVTGPPPRGAERGQLCR